MTLVRSIGSGEVSALYQLRLRALAEDPNAFDQTVEYAEEQGLSPIAELVASAIAGRDLVLVAQDGDKLSALVMVSRSRRPRSQHRARLWGMWVAPEARRQGVGSALLTQAVQWCRAQGIEMVDLWVVTDHRDAVRVYERAGFRICGTARDGMRWQGRPQDEHQMTLHLPPQAEGPAQAAELVDTVRQ